MGLAIPTLFFEFLLQFQLVILKGLTVNRVLILTCI